IGTKGSRDDRLWVTYARAEVRVWEQDPATEHACLERACDAYRQSINLLEDNVYQVCNL
ncbi:unnamed protein product, partial [Choristocarpus tenellus]